MFKKQGLVFNQFSVLWGYLSLEINQSPIDNLQSKILCHDNAYARPLDLLGQSLER